MSPRQTKTASFDRPALAPEQIENLRRGAEHFNAGRFFEAHEDWEIRWRHLPPVERPQVQAAILVCGVFVLLEKRRLDPAMRLAKLAVERFAEAAAQSALHDSKATLRLPDAEDRMLRVLARIRLGESDADRLRSEAIGLRANLADRGKD
ncbi:MAG: DUF309 domain-containing protein [Bdellovibrionales bacterium]|nr:DUF309 domain-containing protein [Bdellovibrionales bacterium]